MGHAGFRGVRPSLGAKANKVRTAIAAVLSATVRWATSCASRVAFDFTHAQLGLIKPFGAQRRQHLAARMQRKRGFKGQIAAFELLDDLFKFRERLFKRKIASICRIGRAGVWGRFLRHMPMLAATRFLLA